MRNIITILTALLLLPTMLFSQSLFESATAVDENSTNKLKLDFNGYGRGSAFVGFDEYNFTTIFGETALIGKLNYNNAFLFSDIRLREGYAFNEPNSTIQFKEVYAGFSSKKFDVLLGNQIVTWGRTDGFNPTNCITPNDYFFLTSNTDDQKLANFMLRFKYRITDQIELDLISIPIYNSSIYRYELFELGENVSFSDMVLPDKTFENAALAARLNFELPKAGFSVSYFRGYNPDYGFDTQSIDWTSGMPVVTNVATPYIKNMIGVDFSIPVKSWIIRGEMAYNITEDYKDKMYVPNPDLSYVAGLERNFSGFNTILQYIGKYTFDFTELSVPVLTDPANPFAQVQYANDLIYYESKMFNRRQFYQQEEFNHALALTVSKPIAYDIWNIELTAYYNFTSEEYMFRPKVSWDISDALSASAGYSYMAGSEKQIFDYAGPVLNGGFIELKVNF
ncbi:MAG TPA: DUF1302 family protein [Bacteroidales bacterium]|nr:DUF1302 family protein [Bacteroidales bacterium]